MRCCWIVLVVLLVVQLGCSASNPQDDNEFAEFEEFDEDDEATVTEGDVVGDVKKSRVSSDESPSRSTEEEDEDEEAVVETEDEPDDEEFEHFHDEDEFEGFDKDQSPRKGKSQDQLPDLEMAKVPLHLRTNWDSFYLEMLMIAGLGVYFLNFLAGKTKNSKLAQAWLNAHRDLLETNFSIVGDDGTSKEVSSGTLIKESENIYALWCSGRVCVEGMLVELKLLKRQDLINTLLRMFKPASDQVIITVDMDKSVMEKFVFAVANKKVAGKMHKDLLDLNYFTEKKTAEKYDIPNSYQILTEMGEVTTAILDKKVCTALTTYEGLVEYIHFSDQFSGPKNQDDSQPAKVPVAKAVLLFCFNVPGKGKTKTSDMQLMKPLMQLVFYFIDKAGRFQLSREGKLKAEKKRHKAEEQLLKATHAQRQEAAQARREEKKRAEKERLLNEEDPDKARKLEDRENRREMKKKQPKMKMMKMKAM